MQFELFTQQPKQAKIGVIGTLSIGKDGNAQLFSGHADAHSSVIGELHRCKIEWAASKGILLSGVEPQGCDNRGNIKYRFQEWFLRYIDRTCPQCDGQRIIPGHGIECGLCGGKGSV